MDNNALPIFVLVTLSLTFVTLGNAEQEEKLQQDHYCEMVELWETSQGENGHPDYKENYEELCNEEGS